MEYKKTHTENNQVTHNKLYKYMDILEFFDKDIEDYIYVYDLNSTSVFLTKKTREKFSIPLTEKNGNLANDWMQIIFERDREYVSYHQDRLFAKEIDEYIISYRMIDRTGKKIWVRVRATLRDIEEGQSVIVGRITEIKSTEIIDGLTEIFNIDKFRENIDIQIKISSGYLMIMDIDDFKNFNITRGREYGDQIIKKVASILKQNIDYHDKLYRLYGDCFAINFIEKEEDYVLKMYESIKKEISYCCTFSAGVVHYCEKQDKLNSEDIYLYAEVALECAKKESKNELVFFSKEYFQNNLNYITFSNEIKQCILQEFKGFELVYQPQIDSKDYSLYGIEVLLRYHSLSKGDVSPTEFIPLLEQTGWICEVGEYILKNAIYQCKEWRKYIPNLHISVNMSYLQLKKEGIAEFVLNLLKEADLPGDALTIELTESVQLQNYRYFNKIFYLWKQNGIKISIDDFGTGYSNLSYLKSIEIDEIKIDRCFVHHVQLNLYNLRLLSNMIKLAHSEKIKVCCEGVETMEELVCLQEMHADVLQGYFFSKPLKKDEFESKYINFNSTQFKKWKIEKIKLQELQLYNSNHLIEIIQKEDMGNIIESMDEIVYVSDIDSYELYYLNAAGRRLVGVYDYQGKKCYEILQGLKKPCDFCTNDKLCKEDFYIWERENKYYQRHFILKDKLIPWKGKMARVEMAFDITEKQLISQSIQNQLDLQNTIIDIYKILSSKSEFKEMMNSIVKIIGKFCDGDRSYFIKLNKEDQEWKVDFEWCAHNKKSMQQDCLNRKEVNIKNNRVLVPILQKNKTNAIIGVDNPSNEKESRYLLESISDFLGYSISVFEDRKN